jgi:hypothetical protein
MRYKSLTQIWNVAMDKPTLDLALRFADTETYDLLRGIGVSMNAASAACDDMLKDVARYYQQPSMNELIDHMEV